MTSHDPLNPNPDLMERALRCAADLDQLLHDCQGRIGRWNAHRDEIARRDRAVRQAALQLGLDLLARMQQHGGQALQRESRSHATPPSATHADPASADPSPEDDRAPSPTHTTTGQHAATTASDPPRDDAAIQTDDHIDARVLAHSALVENAPRRCTPSRSLGPARIRALEQALNGRQGWSAPNTAARAEHLADEVLGRLRKHFGNPPARGYDAATASSDLGLLRRGFQQADEVDWQIIEAPAARSLLSFLAARMRGAQDALADDARTATAEHTQLCRDLARNMTDLVRRTACGHVYGLALSHTPRHGHDWFDDVRHHRRRLDALMGVDLQESPGDPPPEEEGRSAEAHRDDLVRQAHEDLRAHPDTPLDAALEWVHRLLDAGVQPRERRLTSFLLPHADTLLGGDHGTHGLPTCALHALRERLDEERDDPEPDDDRRNALPDDWPLWHRTRGRTAVIVGGSPRNERLEPIRNAFGFGDLEWLDGIADGSRQVQALCHRMRNGSVDLVLVLQRFISHSHADALFQAAKDSDAHAVLATSYGITSLRQGLERTFASELVDDDDNGQAA